VSEMLRSADIVFTNVPYNYCRVLRAACTNGDCRTCTIPLVMKKKAQSIIYADSHGLDWREMDWDD